MDRLIINGLMFHCHCGTTPGEREVGQQLKASVEILGNFEKAANKDLLKYSVDYTSICKLLLKMGKKARFRLLETLATKMADEILLRFRVKEVSVRLEKTLPPLDEILNYFAVEVTRKKPGKGENKKRKTIS